MSPPGATSRCRPDTGHRKTHKSKRSNKFDKFHKFPATTRRHNKIQKAKWIQFFWHKIGAILSWNSGTTSWLGNIWFNNCNVLNIYCKRRKKAFKGRAIYWHCQVIFVLKNAIWQRLFSLIEEERKNINTMATFWFIEVSHNIVRHKDFRVIINECMITH